MKYIKLSFGNIWRLAIYLIMVLAVVQCKNAKDSPPDLEDESTKNPISEISIPNVKITSATYGDFITTINATGRIIAKKMGPVVSEASGKLVDVYFKEGDYIQEGQLLASLDSDRLKLDIEQAKNDLDKAAYDRQIKIIEAGGEVGDSTYIDPIINKNINIQVGYPSAVTRIKQLELELFRRQIYAPYSGVITEQLLFKNQQISSGQTLFTVLDRSSIRIEGYILDEDIDKISVGQKVTYNTLGNSATKNARVSIKRNLTGEETRMIRVECRPSSTKGLVLGQSAQINIISVQKNVLSIPKSAVVKRSGRDVVFTYESEKGGLAKWNYVKIGEENGTSIVILEGLDSGLELIYEGNLNLAHDENVQLSEY